MDCGISGIQTGVTPLVTERRPLVLTDRVCPPRPYSLLDWF
ncbi:hypothetical protein OK016_28810 [Vibrio chagasii]|nr:hypothetical protein [Vibrio chagasii]